ncbi:MAG: hypothetical protein U0359_17135 [Byssovorax sp.]
MLGLRLRDGLDLAAAAGALGLDPWPASRRRAAERHVAAGRLIVEGGRVRLPPARASSPMASRPRCSDRQKRPLSASP